VVSSAEGGSRSREVAGLARFARAPPTGELSGRITEPFILKKGDIFSHRAHLKAVAVQLLPPGVNLSQTLQGILQAVDLRMWIQKGVEKLWMTLQAMPVFQTVEGKILGQALTDKLRVGDPWLIWVVRNGKNNSIQILIDGTSLTTRLDRWEAAYRGQNNPNAAVLQQITDVRTRVVDLQNQNNGLYTAVLGAIEDLQAARKLPKPKNGQPDPVQTTTKKLKAAREAATAELSKLVKILNELLSKIEPALGNYTPLPMEAVSVPWGSGTVRRATGVTALITRVGMPHPRSDFYGGASNPSWWDEFQKVGREPLLKATNMSEATC